MHGPNCGRPDLSVLPVPRLSWLGSLSWAPLARVPVARRLAALRGQHRRAWLLAGVVPTVVELEVAVPRLMPAAW
jgi:hypothetical protein